MSEEETVQRALGRIEGSTAEILKRLDRLANDFGEHKNDDQRAFSSVRKLVKDGLADQDSLREAQLAKHDTKLDLLKQDQDRAKGAGWVILGLLASLATFLGGAVLAVWNGWLRVH